MLTKEDFILRYQTLSDPELYHIYTHEDDFSPEAQEAAIHIIGERGGIEQVLSRAQEWYIRKNEVARLADAATRCDPVFRRPPHLLWHSPVVYPAI
jgi:hypothetical protein